MHPQSETTRRTDLLEAVSFSATAFLRARQWRDAVEPVLAALGRSMGVTRVHLFRTIAIDGDVVRSRQAHEWAVSPAWSERDSPELRDFTLGAFALPAGGEPTAAERVLTLRVADFEEPARSRWRARGIVSGAAVALFVGGERWGALGVDDCTRERDWTPEERHALLAVADVFGAAIERARAEQALRESEARLSLALEGSAQGLWDWHIPSGRVHFDALWCRMLGYEPGELEPRVEQWEALLHPEERAGVRELVRRHLEGELPSYSKELRLRHADGSWRWFLDRGQVVERDADGRALRMVGTHMDVTDRKASERMQQEQAEALRLLYRAVEQSPASIVVTDRSGAIVYVNSRFTQITGYSAAEALGANPSMLRSGTHPPEFYRELWDTITAARDWRGEICNRRKDGSVLWEHMSISPVVDAGGTITHYVAVKEDITERRALEEQLRHSQKLDAFGQLAGGVAHDFNNMLTVISGFAALLEPELGEEGEGRAYLAEVQHAARRSAELTQQLLALSRKQILNPVLVDLNGLVARFQLMLQRVLGEDIRLVTRVWPRPLMVRADPGQLEQVLLNLAVNARDAMPNGGQLTIATAEQPAGDDAESAAEVVVTDTGTGIAPEHIDRIFEPFFTTKPIGRGTGLGLSTVYGIVTQSGGSVSVEMPPGGGSCFRVRLPLMAPVDAAAPAAAVAPARTRGSGTVLVVEDEDAVRSLAVAILERAGYHALSAKEGAAALELLEGPAAPVDLVLADVVMPGIGGRELSSILQQRFPGVPVLFMSGHTDDHVLRHGVEQEGVAFISKPFSPDALLARVQSMLVR